MSTQFLLWYTVSKNGHKYIALGLLQDQRLESPLVHHVCAHGSTNLYAGESGKRALSRTTTSQLDRSDERCGLLGPWSNRVLERSRVAGRDVGQQREEKPAREGTNLSRDRSSGEPKKGEALTL